MQNQPTFWQDEKGNVKFYQADGFNVRLNEKDVTVIIKDTRKKTVGFLAFAAGWLAGVLSAIAIWA